MNVIPDPTAKTSKINIHPYSFGIEEEFFITKLSSRETCQTMPKRLEELCADPSLPMFERELLQSQIEAATPPMTDMEEAHRRLTTMRATLKAVAHERGYGVVAAGTHPKALRMRQRNAEGARYQRLMRDLQILGQRNMVCGLHIHVQPAELGNRLSLMARLTPFLPLLLALSTSSPFWEGRATGLMGYRLASYDELPRTGLPELFGCVEEYQRYIETMVGAKAIKDASYVWWAVRPSLNNPTLELRVADACTHVEDALAIAALFRSLVRRLERDSNLNAHVNAATRAIALENKWRAQRYGVRGTFIDEERRAAVPVRRKLEDLIALVTEDAEALGCLPDVLHARQIIKRGASANTQVAIYKGALKGGANRVEALNVVVDWLLSATSPAMEASEALKLDKFAAVETRALN